jgi:hypothetical protein
MSAEDLNLDTKPSQTNEGQELDADSTENGESIVNAYERGKSNHIVARIAEMLHQQSDSIPAEDQTRLESIAGRIDMVLGYRESKIAEIAESNGVNLDTPGAAEKITTDPTSWRLQNTRIPLVAEVGEGGSRYIRSDGSRDFWARTPEQAAQPAYQFENFDDIPNKFGGGEIMSGQMADATKTALFEALGVTQPGQSIEDAAKKALESEGKRYWDKEYTATLPTAVNGVLLEVTYKDASRQAGGMGRTFDADLVIPHKTGDTVAEAA